MTLDQLVSRLKGRPKCRVRAKTKPNSTHISTRFINYFKAIRAAFNDRSIRRGIIVAEDNDVACQTWIEGTFFREFTQSPAGALPPNGQRVVWDLLNIFRLGDQGRMVEERVRTDYRSFLRQLGTEGK